MVNPSHVFIPLALATATSSCGPSTPPSDAAVDPPGSTAPASSATAPAVDAPPAEAPTSAPAASSATPTASSVASAAPAAPACTELGCESGLTLPLVWGKDTLTSSKYTFELTVDGKKGKCEVVWPYKSCAEVRVPKCSGDVAFTLETKCTGEAKSTSDMVIGPIRLAATPAAATLKIWREKVMWHQQDLTLSYADARPNGPGCEPVCKQASKRVCIGQCRPEELAAAPPDVPR
jgi:hypothetical protein